MIDIHTHILHQVDDGSSDKQTSIQMIKNLQAEGVSGAILTPHYRGKFVFSKSEIEEKFNELKKELLAQEIDFDIYLGQELFITKEYKNQIKQGTAVFMADKKYLLCEFDYSSDNDIADIVYEIKTMGYKPIVAHYERYDYATLDTAYEIKSCGGYIQVNASSIVNPTSGKQKKLVKRLFKENLVDFVASDIHEFRAPNVQKAYSYVQKKFGVKIANAVFIENPKKIIEG